MCPDPQIISIYVDEELPSPWKEKMESHLKGCSACRDKLENFRRLRELFKKNTQARRTYVEKLRIEGENEKTDLNEPEAMEKSKDKVWRCLESRRRFRHQRSGLWQRRLAIPLPAAAAAAAVILVILAALWLRGGFPFNQGEPSRANLFLAAEEEMPGIIPAADMNGVLQYLSADGTDIIILRLPESKNFNRAGEPAIIRAADYSQRRQ